MANHPSRHKEWINAGLTLVQRLRRWTNDKPTLIQRLVSAGHGHVMSWHTNMKKSRLLLIPNSLLSADWFFWYSVNSGGNPRILLEVMGEGLRGELAGKLPAKSMSQLSPIAARKRRAPTRRWAGADPHRERRSARYSILVHTALHTLPAQRHSGLIRTPDTLGAGWGEWSARRWLS